MMDTMKDALTLDQRMQGFGMNPNLKRRALLPDYSAEDGFIAPQWAYDVAKGAVLPGHVAQGGNYQLDDVTNMAAALAGTGYTGASMQAIKHGVPKSTLGAFALPMTPDVRNAYAKRGRAMPVDVPVGAKGQEVMVASPYSKTLKTPLSFHDDLDQGLQTAPVAGMGNRQELNIQDLVGEKIFPLVGDRTSREQIIKVLNQPITEKGGFNTEGGFDYTLNQDTGLWASHLAPVNRLQKEIVENQGGIGVSLPMAGTSSDFSMQGIDLAYSMDSIKNMNPAAKKYLDKAIGKRVDLKNTNMKNKNNTWPDFPGLNSPDAYGYFKKYPESRKFFMEEIDKKDVRAMPTMPDALAIRHGLTEVGLRNLVRGDTDALAGQSFVNFGANPQIRNTGGLNSPHNTYQADLYNDVDPNAGYMGGLPLSGVPRSLLFPKYVDAQRSLGRTPVNIDSNYKMALPFEKVTTKLADNIDQYLFDIKKDAGY